METTRLSSKGQVIIPKALRDIYAWQAGLEFLVVDTGDGVLLRPKRPFEPTKLDEVAGCLAHSGSAKSVEEMDAAIAVAIQERWHDSG